MTSPGRSRRSKRPAGSSDPAEIGRHVDVDGRSGHLELDDGQAWIRHQAFRARIATEAPQPRETGAGQDRGRTARGLRMGGHDRARFALPAPDQPFEVRWTKRNLIGEHNERRRRRRRQRRESGAQ